MENDFFQTMKKVVKQRKTERYVANRQWIVDHLKPDEYKLLDNIKAVLIRVTEHNSVIFYLTMNKWKYQGKYLLGTPYDCINWIKKEVKL